MKKILIVMLVLATVAGSMVWAAAQQEAGGANW